MATRRRVGVIVACIVCGTPACADDAGPGQTGDSSTGAPGSDSGMSGAMTSAADTGSDSTSSDRATTGSDETAGTDTGPPTGVSARLFDVAMGIPDPRWPEVPDTLSIVQLPPEFTFVADVVPGTQSVRFTLDDGAPVVDTAAPFVLDEDRQGNAVASGIEVGAHSLRIETFESPDAGGTPTATADVPLTITTDGTLAKPAQHAVHRMWRTDSGTYVHRDRAGDFLDSDDNLVIAAGNVSTVEMGAGQGHLVVSGGGEGIEFAFIVLLPDGFDATVPYPLVVFLHHGGEGYRGTDNDGTPLDAPLLGGPRSLVNAPEQRSKFPAIVLVPQMRQVQNIDGVTHEWAAFSSIDGATGSFTAGATPSVNSIPVLETIDALLAGTLVVNGATPTVDPARVYLSGHSMGGLGSWDLVGRFPDRWAAVIPMAGYSEHTTAPDLVDTPIWAFHHEIDSYNPAIGTQTMFSLISETHGGMRMRFNLMTFDTGGAGDQAHFQTPSVAWGQEPGIFEWLFGQINDRLP